MRIFVALILLGFLAVASLPIALMVLILFPFVWLMLLPFRLAAVAVHLVFTFFRLLIFLPFRILGMRC